MQISGIRNIINNLQEFERQVMFAVDMQGGVAATLMENYAKDNKKWINQTGAAQRGLMGYSIWRDTTLLQVGVYHTVPYGLWLELANDRKYAILEEARDSQINSFLREIKRVIR